MPKGEIGVLWVRGPNVFQGSWQMPEKTAEELREVCFFITGDLGLIDERGHVHIVGRGKDLIISGGCNIYPKEIELFLDDLPGVLASAVIGVPHPDFSESVVAVLVPEAGTTIDPEAALKAVSRDLAGFQAPAPHRDRPSAAAQHNGQGAEEPAVRILRACVQCRQGLTLFRRCAMAVGRGPSPHPVVPASCPRICMYRLRPDLI